MHRLIIEMGMGNDLYGMDYTKAAKRAVEDAFRHSTLSIFKSLNLDSNKACIRIVNLIHIQMLLILSNIVIIFIIIN